MNEPAENWEDLAKRSGKNIRQSMRDDGGDSKKQRKGVGRRQKLDVSDYVERYPDMQLFWAHENNGDVEMWIEEGAEPVPQNSGKAAKKYDGLYTSKTKGKWVTQPVGRDGEGGFIRAVLLMMPKQDYAELKTIPDQERNAEIRELMLRGKSLDDENQNMPTYAPNLPTGGVGFQEVTPT